MKLLQNSIKTTIFVCPAYDRCDRIFAGNPNCLHSRDHILEFNCKCGNCHGFENVKCKEMEE